MAKLNRKYRVLLYHLSPTHVQPTLTFYPQVFIRIFRNTKKYLRAYFYNSKVSFSAFRLERGKYSRAKKHSLI